MINFNIRISDTKTSSAAAASPIKIPDSPKSIASSKPRNDKNTATTSAVSSSIQTTSIISMATSAVPTKTIASVKSSPITTTSSEDNINTSSVQIIPPTINLIKNNKGIVPIPKAEIKPTPVLTHFIGGHVIQEGTEPFPITRQRYPDDSTDEPPTKRQNLSSPDKSDRLSCSHCGKSADSKGKLKHKPYCSKSCLKAAKAGAIPTIQQNGDHKLRIKNEDSKKNGSQSPSPSSSSIPSPSSSSGSTNGTNETANGIPAEMNDTKKSNANTEQTSITETMVSNDVDMEQDEPDLFKWSVDEVCEYIRTLSGYSDYAEDFANHEIDGQALVLLNETHLVNTMNIKLGPALKIMSHIKAMKKNGPPTNEQQSQ